MKKLLFLLVTAAMAACQDGSTVTPPGNDSGSILGPVVYGKLTGSDLGSYMPYSSDTAKVPTIATQNYVLSAPFIKSTGQNTLSGVLDIHKSGDTKSALIIRKSVGSSQTAPTSLGLGSEYLRLGGGEWKSGSYRLIGFGYGSDNSNAPVQIGYNERGTSSNTWGDFIVATRYVSSNTAPLIRFRIDYTGQILAEDPNYEPGSPRSLTNKKYVDAQIALLMSKIDSLSSK